MRHAQRHWLKIQAEKAAQCPKPIGEAPIDGTRILAWEPQGGWVEVRWEEEDPDALTTGYWYSDHHCDWLSDIKPTHWIPLPEEPE